MPAHKLTTVQLFYVEHHHDSKSAENLAAELELPVAAVRNAIRRIRAERKKSQEALASVAVAPEPGPAVVVPMFEDRGGSMVAMTGDRSFAEDEAMKRLPQGSQHPRYSQYVGKIDPNKPSR